MSKTTNGRSRTNSARQSYVEQVSYNQHRKKQSFTRLHSYDDTDIAYRSAPEYLKQLMNTSTLSNGHSARSITRTQSASDMTSPNNFNRPASGNPKYKTQEEYYDEIQVLKKELKYTKDDNSNLRARIRRLEEDNVRKRKEIDNFYDTKKKDSDTRRTLTSSSNSNANAVMNLKQRLFKLESQLKQKETIIDEMKSDPRWTKSTELEIQNRALFNELEKQKLEKLNLIQHDYMASIDEEKKNAIRKLEAEKRELKIENDNLKKKLHEMEKLERDELLSSRQRDGSTDRDLHRKIEGLKNTCRNYQDELDQMKNELKQMRHERDKYRDKFDSVNDDLEKIKYERDQYRKKFDRVNNDLDEIQSDRFQQTKSNLMDRSSSIVSHRESSSSEELIKKGSRSSTPLQKSKEYIGARSSLTKFDRNTPSPSITRRITSRNYRRDDWNSDDENHLKNFREKHAATVIQRGWREHKKSHRSSFLSKTRQHTFDKRNSKIGGIKSSETQSPRTSQQKLGSKIDNLDSSYIKNRPTSANISNETALKIVQASLRGYVNRNEIDKTFRPEKLHRVESDDDDDIIGNLSKQFGSQYGSDKKRENFYRDSKQNFADRSGLHNDKIGSNSRLPTSNRDSTSNFRRPLSPSSDNYRPSSPNMSSRSNSKQFLPNDQNKFGFDNRNNRESFLKFQRSSSPLNDYRLSQRTTSPEDIRPSSRQSNMSLTKSPIHSKQSLKNTYNKNNDDGNVSDF